MNDALPEAAFSAIGALMKNLRGPAPCADDLWRLRCEIEALAPAIPGWAVGLIGRTLANPRAGADTLLVLADALAEGARVAAIEGYPPAIGRQLNRLAGIPRSLVPALTIESSQS